VTALAPVRAGRAIVGGTFTHPSPLAAFVYRGDAGRAPITRLAEQLDGRSLFGRPLTALDAAAFDAYTERLRLAAVVALEDDAPNIAFLSDNPRFRRRAVPPFLVFVATAAPAVTRAIGRNVWEASLTGSGAWRSTGIAYFPLWRAEEPGVETRRGVTGDLEVKVDGGGPVRLVYGPGWIEIGALALTAAAAIALGAERWRRAARAT
jgi:hypothetical protein